MKIITQRMFVLVLLIDAGWAGAEDLSLWYRQPAANWNEALPVGNGRLGGMIFGGVENELIQLNEDSVWSGRRYAIERPEVKQNLAAVRQLIFEGKYAEAQELVERTMTTKPDPRYGAYQPLGDLRLSFMGVGGAPTEYRRELDLERAIARTTFVSGGARYVREVFASAPAHVLVIHLTCDRPRQLSLKVDLTRNSRHFISNTVATCRSRRRVQVACLPTCKGSGIRSSSRRGSAITPSTSTPR